MTASLRILCVGAHPDDVEIGMGGTVASLVAKGHQLKIIDLTNGEPTPFGSVETRLKEAAASATLLKAGRKTLSMPNRFLTDSIENRKMLAAEIRQFQPDYMFAPYFDDAHPDHIAASALADAARFYAKLTKSDIEGQPWFPKRVIYYFPIHVRLSLHPSFLVDITDTIDIKRRAISCYQSQFEAAGKFELVEQFLAENQNWGFQAGTKAAEPFYQKEIPTLSWPDGYL